MSGSACILGALALLGLFFGLLEGVDPVPVDGPPLGIVLGLKLLEALESLEGVAVVHSLPLEQFKQLLLLEVSIIIQQVSHAFLGLPVVKLLKLVEVALHHLRF